MEMASKVSKRAHARPLRPKRKTAAPMTRPIVETVKPKGVISTSTILKRKPMKEVYGKKHAKRGRSEPQHDLSIDFKDRVEVSRNSLLNESTVEFKRIHTDLIDSLKKLHMEDVAFHNSIEEEIKELRMPLEEEMVETSFTHGDGTKNIWKCQIGQRIEVFRADIKKKETEIKQLWQEWENVQKQIVELGVAVLEPKTLEGGGVDIASEKRGYRKEMELLDQEHETWLKKVQKEMRRINQEAIDKMTAAEKEINAQQKREQASFFIRLFEDDG